VELIKFEWLYFCRAHISFIGRLHSVLLSCTAMQKITILKKTRLEQKEAQRYSVEMFIVQNKEIIHIKFEERFRSMMFHWYKTKNTLYILKTKHSPNTERYICYLQVTTYNCLSISKFS
jgi:hypothetical protein